MGRRRSTVVLTADERLNALPTEALECRDLRHAWPRRTGGQTRLVPTKTRAGRVVAADREMECTGGCGTVRVEHFEIYPDGRMARVGNAIYRRTKPYLLKAAEPGTVAIRVDRDEVRYALLTRMYPDLRW